MDAQLALRGKSFPRLTVKPLWANPAGPRPPKRNDGYNRSGPYALQAVPKKSSSFKAPKREPPPPPPKVPARQPVMMPPLPPLPSYHTLPPLPFSIPIPKMPVPAQANVTPSSVEPVPEVEPGRISSPELDEEDTNDGVDAGVGTRAKAKSMARHNVWRVTWLWVFLIYIF